MIGIDVLFGVLAVSGLVASERTCLPKAPEYKPDITYTACYADDPNSPILTGRDYRANTQNSPEFCALLCGREGYRYAGLEQGLGFGGGCFCGNSVPPWVEKQSRSSCDLPCPGDPAATCGGNSTIDIYRINNPQVGKANDIFADCTRDPLCSNPVCDPSLSVRERAAGLVNVLSVEEKLDTLVDKTPGVPRLGIWPYEWWSEALHGLAYAPGNEFEDSGNFSSATSFPMPIVMAASFNDDLVFTIGEAISIEARAYANAGLNGFDFYTPNINLFRDPRWGRGSETPGEDPLLAKNYVASLISSMEYRSSGHKRILATCKHYVGNDLESVGNVSRYGFDAVISTQDLSEYFLPPFRTCTAQKQVSSVMCSYNAVNGVPACADSYILQDILRDHWGWEAPDHYITTDCGVIGYMVTDHHYASDLGESAALALKAGTDLECNGSPNSGLLAAWNRSLITEPEVDRAAQRLYGALVTVGLFDNPPSLESLGWEVVNSAASQQLAYQSAVEGTVLIKNNGALPLSSNKSYALIGPWAAATEQLQGIYYGPAPFLISPLQAARDLGINYTYVAGTGINQTDPSTYDAALVAARSADAVIFLGGIDSSFEEETQDRESLEWPAPQKELITALAENAKQLVVVRYGGGQLDDSELLTNKHVNGLLWGGYPGQSGGQAIMDLLFGKASPAGRLPVTQYPAWYADAVPPADMSLRPGKGNSHLGRTYMWYEGETAVPFGFGLHYTTFDVTINQPPRWMSHTPIHNGARVSIQSIKGPADWMELLEVPALQIPVTVTNTGPVTSDYVLLLFLKSDAGPSPRPLKTLAAYTRIKDIQPGQSVTRDLTVNLDSLVRVDQNGDRVIYPGVFDLFVDLDAKATFAFRLHGAPLTVEKFPQRKAKR
ncbi:hypothetical protein ASPVEDRAFT_46646 [Aspergillus versicolor CBS 583.65]|uniref:xylan 1,4-beta-xylosidase n=1 Tax=Aspergillus versicolor CBS 583.65 TaxID=1036611 RepID=A0A1L9Q0M8_ASPVE|nr:uncharacterized protein ASPVEDRAFT_46646 [Aspergillus versicolor CBS 583.65]OJJ07305.1 hypothetical protein ASPVEDRAFT_46646 [Aspergillus versicolor CBS 583.65]